jgi:hypothetical protein
VVASCWLMRRVSPRLVSLGRVSVDIGHRVNRLSPDWRRQAKRRMGVASAGTATCLPWWCDRSVGPGITALRLILDNASGPTNQAVRAWIRRHHERVKTRPRDVRVVARWLPVKSPWLNPIEPKGATSRAIKTG